MAGLDVGGSPDGGIAAEVRARHGHSAQPESMAVVAVLGAVLDTIREQEGMQATPTAIFAALMSALERAEAAPQTALAMCTLLGITLARVPDSVLRAKFVGSVQLLGGLVERNRQQTAVAKAGLLCLGQVLAAVEQGAWPAAAPGFQLLLSFTTDARPKVRKRAQQSVGDVLAGLQACPSSLAAASEAVVALCRHVLPGPAAAARAAAAASNKQRAAAEAKIAAAVADVLHTLGALKGWVPLMAGSSVPGLVDLLVKLYALQQPLLSRHTSEVLGCLVGNSASHISAGQLAQLLQLLIEGEAAALLAGAGAAGSSSGGSSGAAGGDALSSMARLLEAGLLNLCDKQPDAAGQLLPKVVHLLVPLMCAEQDGVRFGASEALRSLLASVLSPGVVDAMQRQGQGQRGGGKVGKAGQGGAPGPLQSLVAAVASCLGARYQESWGLGLPVVGTLCEALAAGGAGALAAPLLAGLGEICAGLADEAEQQEQEAGAADMAGAPPGGGGPPAGGSSAYAAAAEAALGAALRSLGPQQVLSALPLQLLEGLQGAAEARTWLLPALRKHVCGAQLGFWARELLPLAKQLGAAAGGASAAGRKGMASACHALELQLWGCLVAFASWPSDAADAYPAVAPELAAAYHTREDLRGVVANALARLCRQARGVAVRAAAAGGADGATLAAIRGLGLVPQAAASVLGAGRGEEPEDEQEAAAAAAAGSDSDGDVEGDSAGGPGGGARHSLGARRGRAAWVREPDAAEEGPDSASHAPPGFTPAVALAQLAALRALGPKWLPLMCRVFIEAEPEERGAVGEALAAQASVSDAALVAQLFKTALGKYAKLVRDAAAEVPPPDPVLEGGGIPEERQASFLELALCLAGGLPDAAVEPLFAACRQHVLGGAPLLQKRAYRVLAYLTASRPGWLAANLAPLLELLLLGSGAALSPAKRYRLRCLHPLILLLDTNPCPRLPGLVDAASGAELVPGGAALAAPGGEPAARRLLLARLLVGELVLATKEVNKKTRAAAYQLLVAIAHELDAARPLSLAGQPGGSGGSGGSSSDEDGMEYGNEPARGGGDDSSRAPSGGLLDFVNSVMAGLVGSSPHMQSATVLALARLVFEFSGQLEGLVGRLLPAVLLLLRSQSREVVKSVLGFSKVCAMRMPVELLLVWLPQMLDGMLLWADDSKNKFRLKIRVIMERLVRRCGLQAVADACPPGDAKLLAHIRKQTARKERRRAGGSEPGSQADGAEFDRRSQLSRGSSAARSAAMARTARASEWGHTAIFSDEAGSDEPGTRGSPGARSERGGGGGGRGRARSTATARGGAGRGGQLPGDSEAADPQDLLEAGTARRLVRSAAGAGGRGGGGASAAAAAAAAADFPRGDDGRLVIREEADPFGWSKKTKGKRKRGEDDFGFGDEDDSDMEDMRGIAGLKAAVASVAHAKSVRFAPSIAASLGNRSLGNRSLGGRSLGGASAVSRRSGGAAAPGRGAQHSGERFRSKGGAGGDVKGGSGVDPYAYWAFDRKMLNRRRGKQAAASKGLSGVVAGAQAGALKGAKAKRAAGGGSGKRARR